MASTPPSVPAPPSRRPHPARRARRIAGTATVAGMLALTGGIAAATHAPSTRPRRPRTPTPLRPRPRPAPPSTTARPRSPTTTVRTRPRRSPGRRPRRRTPRAMAAELRFRAMGSDVRRGRRRRSIRSSRCRAASHRGPRTTVEPVPPRQRDQRAQRTRRILRRGFARHDRTGDRAPSTCTSSPTAGSTRPCTARSFGPGTTARSTRSARRRAAVEQAADGAERILVAADAVALPVGTGFDPGGIGKGLAADIVVDELVAEGAAGMCINLGGDVRRAA